MCGGCSAHGTLTLTLTLALTLTLTLAPTLTLTLTLTLALTRHVHGARLRVRARLARRTLRVGHLPRPDVDGGGRQVGLVQRPRRVRHGHVPVRGGVELARLR